MCEFFGVSRAAYYGWVKRLSQPDPDEEKMKRVQEAYDMSRQTYGYRRITLWLRQKRNVHINHKAVLRLMNKLGIRSIARRRRLYPRTQELNTFHRYPNLLNRDFSAGQPNQKWVTDISFIPTRQGWAYLSTIKDLFDGFIVAHQFSPTNSVSLVIQTLQLAHQKGLVTDGLILHSDQGHQYSSHSYYVLTQQYHIQPSMSRPANCWDNAPMESFFSHLKQESLSHLPLLSFEATEHAIDDYIAFYNYQRIQLKTGQTPFQHRCLST
jgi:putative transposase